MRVMAFSNSVTRVFGSRDGTDQSEGSLEHRAKDDHAALPPTTHE